MLSMGLMGAGAMGRQVLFDHNLCVEMLDPSDKADWVLGRLMVIHDQWNALGWTLNKVNFTTKTLAEQLESR